MAVIGKGKKGSAAETAAAAADIERAVNSIAKNERTVAQVLADQTKENNRVAANRETVDLAHNHGQQAMDDKQARLESVWASVASLAHEVADTFKDDADFSKFAESLVKHDEEKAMSWRTAMDFLKAHANKDQLARLPWPGTKYDDLPAGSNQLPDEIQVWRAEGDTGRWVKTTFYREMAIASPRGQYWAKVAADNPPDRISKDSTMDSTHKRANKALRNITRMMAGAGKLLIQIDRMELLTGLTWGWDKDDKGNIRPVPEPIIIQHTADISKRKKFSIDKFCRFRITTKLTKAAPEKVTLSMLENSIPKREDASKTSTVSKKYEQLTPGEMLVAMQETVSRYKTGDITEMDKRHTSLVEMINSSDEAKMTVVELYRILKPLCEAKHGELMRLADQARDRIEAAIEAKRKEQNAA